MHLLNVPQSDNDWQSWSFHHRISHQQIIQAIQSQKKISLAYYLLDPISPNDVPGFLERNSQSHIEMNAVLGLETTDLQDVNLADERQLRAWIYLHYIEHFDAEQALRISS